MPRSAAPCAGTLSRLRLGRARSAVDQEHRGELRRLGGARCRLVLPVLGLARLDQAVDAARAHDARERLAVGEHQAHTGDLDVVNLPARRAVGHVVVDGERLDAGAAHCRAHGHLGLAGGGAQRLVIDRLAAELEQRLRVRAHQQRLELRHERELLRGGGEAPVAREGDARHVLEIEHRHDAALQQAVELARAAGARVLVEDSHHLDGKHAHHRVGAHRRRGEELRAHAQGSEGEKRTQCGQKLTHPPDFPRAAGRLPYANAQRLRCAVLRLLVLLLTAFASGWAMAQSYSGTFTTTNQQGGTVTLVLKQDAQSQVKGTLTGNDTTFQVAAQATPQGLMGTVSGQAGSLYLMAQYEGANLIVILAEPGPTGQPNLQAARRLVFAKASASGKAPAPAGGKDGEISQFLTRNAWCGFTYNQQSGTSSTERVLFHGNGSADGANWTPQPLQVTQDGKEYMVCN